MLLYARYNALDDRYNAKVEEGLSKFLTFLREEEERERLEEIERLKPIGTKVRILHILDSENYHGVEREKYHLDIRESAMNIFCCCKLEAVIVKSRNNLYEDYTCAWTG